MMAVAKQSKRVVASLTLQNFIPLQHACSDFLAS